LEVIPGGIHDLRTIFDIIGPTPFQFINSHFLEPPPSPTVIEPQGATDLDQVGSNYFLYAHGTISGPSGTASGGTLTVTDGSHTANIALLGHYMASTFVTSSDGHGGTNVVDRSATETSQASHLVQPHHT